MPFPPWSIALCKHTVLLGSSPVLLQALGTHRVLGARALGSQSCGSANPMTGTFLFVLWGGGYCEILLSLLGFVILVMYHACLYFGDYETIGTLMTMTATVTVLQPRLV